MTWIVESDVKPLPTNQPCCWKSWTYHTIQYGIFTRTQKLTRWPA